MNTPAFEIAQTITSRRDAITDWVFEKDYALHPELQERYGDRGRELYRRDNNYHLQYLTNAIAAGQKEIFLDYISWAKTMLLNYGVRTEDLLANLELLAQGFQELLPSEVSTTANEFLRAGINCIRAVPDQPPSYLRPDNPHRNIAEQYLSSLLATDRNRALAFILDHVQSDIQVSDMYLNVFQPVQYEVGLLWQLNKISVGQEHYCTAVTQFIMSQLYPFIMQKDKNEKRVVTSCVGEDLHELGLRMVADFFEMNGWQTYYLGANTPTDSILKMIEKEEADVLALSVTMAFHLGTARKVIDEIRTSAVGRHIKILVGGYPCNVAPTLWQDLGADGSATNAREAVRLAERLVSSS